MAIRKYIERKIKYKYSNIYKKLVRLSCCMSDLKKNQFLSSYASYYIDTVSTVSSHNTIRELHNPVVIFLSLPVYHLTSIDYNN